MIVNRTTLRWGLLFFLISVAYALWSFTFTDPNLYFSSSAPFVSFQQLMWSIPLVWKSAWYVIIVSVWLAAWIAFLRSVKELKQVAFVFACSTLPLLLSNNALSHDVFNYIFNARMVVKYGADPHVQVALQFASDTWTRFMHNIHTPAPYWYGWTALSLLPYLLGFNIFALTYVLFRLWSVVAALGLLYFYRTIMMSKKTNSLQWTEVAMVMLHPLFLIEFVSNSHNDLWLMMPALFSLYLIKARTTLPKIALSLLLLLISISTKYVTVVLLPIWILMILAQKNQHTLLKHFSRWQWDLAALALFVPLLLPRAQFFHPWYLIWSLSFYPLIKSKWLKMVLLSLSISSVYRYVPWLSQGAFEYTSAIVWQQRLITWVGAAVVLCVFLIVNRSNLQVEK